MSSTNQEFKESNHSNDSEQMSDECHNGTKEREYGVQHRPKEKGDEEEDKEDCCIEYNGAERDNSDANQWTGWYSAVNGERLDEHVCDDEESSQDRREDDL